MFACFKISVAEQHHFYVALALGENFDAAPALAPTLLLYISSQTLKIIVNTNRKNNKISLGNF
jgi:hypothetical protein